MEFEGGGAAVIHADYLLPDTSPTHGEDRIRIAGSRGVIEVRNGRCELMNREHGPKDITDTTQPPALHQELLDAVADSSHAIYNTHESLKTAALLLDCRDAADNGRTVRVSAPAAIDDRAESPAEQPTDRSGLTK